MVYITGDVHGDLDFFKDARLKKLTEDDTLIICGDFGFLWDGSEKEKKALKGDKLIDTIGILALLLEYNVCLQLGIDNQAEVRERLRRIASWKQFQNYYQKESEQKKT